MLRGGVRDYMPPLLELPPVEEPLDDEPALLGSLEDAPPLELPISLDDEPVPALPLDEPLPKSPLDPVLPPMLSDALPELLAPPLAPAPAAPA